jgi:hypothetical protein
MAVSILPISGSSIRYGSSDVGRTVHNAIPELNEAMKEAGRILNLKGHLVGDDQVEIFGPADIEGHQGTDGRYYLLDFARVAPPQPPARQYVLQACDTRLIADWLPL